jgi:hypothetical protein
MAPPPRLDYRPRMRPGKVVLLLPALLSSLACTPTDPDLAKPCDQRRTATLQVGSGATGYLPVGTQGIPLETDPTLDTPYFWVGVACHGLGPDVDLTFGITDVVTGIDLTGTLSQRVELVYDSDADQDELGGLYAYFSPQGSNHQQGHVFTRAEQLVGREITLWAEAVDTCHQAPLRSTATTPVSGYDPTTCMGCLDGACGPQVAACGADCIAIQACLDAYCVNLSALASPDETTCQSYCQSQHLEGKQAHLALVGCVQSSACQPPCSGYSIDYAQCVAAQDTGACADADASCDDGCHAYQTCLGSCGTWAACQACSATPKGAAGEKRFETYQRCLESTCIAQGWLPHI